MKSKLLLFVLLAISPFAWSHKSSDSFINLQINNEIITGQWDIAIRDLEFALELDDDSDGAITWFELRNQYPEIKKYAFSRLQINNNVDECELQTGQLQVDHHSDGTYAVLNFDYICSAPVEQLDLGYQLLFELDPTHRGLVQINKDKSNEFRVFSPDIQRIVFDFKNSNQWQTFRQFVTEGIWHIWIGYDHILFLICLLLPSVVRKSPRGWIQNQHFSSVVWQVSKIVTAFTIAHSITLLLAIIQWINLPSRWVESAIAFSVILAAMNNLYPFFNKRAWLVAFTFGLIHGFGFASVLSDLTLTAGNIGLSLAGFNLGVEIGQLAIVLVFLPIAFLLRNYWFYRRVVLYAGSQAIVFIALIWFLQRAFELNIFNA